MVQSTRRRQLFRRYSSIYLLIMPVLIYFAVFSFYPLVLGIVSSFQKTKLLGGATFVGLENYKAALQDKAFIQALRNSVWLGFVSTVATLSSALILAILLYEVRSKTLRKVIQTTTFLPFLFSWTVVGGIWIYLLSHRGLVNSFLNLMGQERLSFMARPGWAISIFAFTAAWKNAGYNALILIAAMMNIPPEIYEAARIDGATRMQQIRHLTLPSLWPTFRTLLLLGVTGMLRNFDQVFVMGNPAINDRVRSLMVYIFEKGITQFDVGLATAAASVVLIITFVLTQASRRLLRFDQAL